MKYLTVEQIIKTYPNVNFEDISTVRISAGVVIEPDAQIGRGVVIEPDAQIGRGAWIGSDAQIGRGAVIFSGARIGRGAAIEADVEIDESKYLKHLLEAVTEAVAQLAQTRRDEIKAGDEIREAEYRYAIARRANMDAMDALARARKVVVEAHKAEAEAQLLAAEQEGQEAGES